jgi:RecG-like helicase
LPPQLRGRVGRGERQSYCYLITNKESTDKLAILAKSTNGFVIAQRDLETRGPGDFLGKEQSGFINKVTLTGVSGSGGVVVDVLTSGKTSDCFFV